MSPSLPLLAAAALAAFAMATVFTRWAARLAPRLAFVAEPDAVNRHGRPVPLLGGAAILLATLPATLCVAAASTVTGAILPALAAVSIMGLAKDRGLRIPTVVQMGVQLAAGLLLARGGLAVDTGAGAWADDAATAVFTVAVVNGFNFLDVQDGLAATIAAFALGAFAIMLAAAGAWNEAALAVSAAGACFGFLMFNRPPACIFMGDTGSFGIGVLLAAFCLAVAHLAPPGGGWSALSPLALLFVEFVATIGLRLASQRSPFRGDGVHVSTEARRFGLSERATLIAAALITFAAAAAAVRRFWMAA